jgi:DNA-binding NarL/FixJ family response regulator
MDTPHGPANPSLKVLVTGVDTMTVHLLAADLRRQQLFQVTECRSTVIEDVLERISADSPCILLLSVRSQELMPGFLELLKEIRGRHPRIRSIVLMNGGGRELIAKLFRAGAKGIFERTEYSSQLLCRCIQCVAEGQIWAKSEQLGFVLDAFVETAPRHIVNAKGEDLLTRRESDVARLVADGFGNREVAQQLGLSGHTVKNYLFNIFDKLGISSRAELIMYVLSNSSIVAVPRQENKPAPVPTSLRSQSLAYEDRAG